MNIWNSNGVIPPIRSEEPTSPLRSPYDISLEQLIQFFAISTKRCEILFGFLEHRAQLHQLGVNKGFQWINGSFAEHVELREQRDPNDIDVVAFIDIRDEQLQLLIRSYNWKGFLSVTLDPSGDSKAKELLDRRLLEIGHGQD